MSDCCRDCEHYVHFMATSLEPADLKGEPWRIGAEWTNPSKGEFIVSCGVLFRCEKKLLSQRSNIGAVEFGPYTQQRSGCEATGGISSSTGFPGKAAKVAAVQMKSIVEAQFYVAVDKSPAPEYELDLKIVLQDEQQPNPFFGNYKLSNIKVTHRAPVVALHYVTHESNSSGSTTRIAYEPTCLERYATRQELSCSMSTWHDFDWEERRLRPAHLV